MPPKKVLGKKGEDKHEKFVENVPKNEPEGSATKNSENLVSAVPKPSGTCVSDRDEEERKNKAMYLAFMLVVFGFIPGVIIAAAGVVVGVAVSAVSNMQHPLAQLGSPAASLASASTLIGNASGPANATAPPAEEMETDFYYHSRHIDDYTSPRLIPVQGLFTPAECEHIIQLVEGSLPLISGRFSELGLESDKDDPESDKAKKIRVSMLTGLPREQKEYRWIYERVWGYAHELNDAYWKYQLPRNLDSQLVENMQFALYKGEQRGHYDWHQDAGVDGPTARRKISITVQMSKPEDYTGGQLQLTTNVDELMIGDMDQGSATFFQSTVLHRVVPVESGTRRSLVLWLQTAD